MKSIIVILLTISVLTACSTQRNPDRLCNLYVRYEQDQGLLKAESSFYIQSDDHENSQVPMEGGVAFLGSNMDLSEKLLRYQTERKIPMPENLSFSWKNDSGEAQNLHIEPNKVGNFNLDLTGEIPVLNLDAPRLSKNEKLTVLFDQPQGLKFNVEVNGPTPTGNIDLTIPDFDILSKSPFSFAVVRTQTYLDDQTNCTCTVTQSIYSDWKEISIQ